MFIIEAIDVGNIKWRGNKTVWITSAGARMAIWQMSDRHLMNTVLMLKREEYYRFQFVAPKYIDIMCDELRRRGIHYISPICNTKNVLKNL